MSKGCVICGKGESTSKNGGICQECKDLIAEKGYDIGNISQRFHRKEMGYCMRCGMLLTHRAYGTGKLSRITGFKEYRKPYKTLMVGDDKYIFCEKCYKYHKDFRIKGFKTLMSKYPYKELEK